MLYVYGAYVDKVTQMKIINNEFVDFAKLLLKERVAREDDHRMELVYKAGATYFVPASDKDGSVINSFTKWEKAFRVFSNIFTREYPKRASELIQYNHVIYSAAMSYYWDNVYLYDKEFRMHMSNFPGRSWAVILPQAWMMYLKDRIRTTDNGNDNGNMNGKGKREICKRFNKGKRTAGFRCAYEHRFLGCGKIGHGVHICRKANPQWNQDGVKTGTSEMSRGQMTDLQANNSNK